MRRRTTDDRRQMTEDRGQKQIKNETQNPNYNKKGKAIR
jgi:hypothetical protein